jgi:hypothetical protein
VARLVPWPGHPSRPKPRCANAWPPERASAGPNWPASRSAGTASSTYIAGQLPGGTTLPLCRLRYTGSAGTWGFAIHRASHDDYQKSVLPSGYPAGSLQEALDCACGLYLSDTTAWLNPPPPKD